MQKTPTAMTDRELFTLCQEYGQHARLWRQKFAGLLPEVARRKLHIKKGFSSIFVFAAKLAGMSEEQVRRVLNLEERFGDKPLLKAMLENGAVSIHKLARIASVVTVENQEFWAGQVRTLPKNALETLIRDEKNATKLSAETVEESENTTAILEMQNGLSEALSAPQSVPGHTNPSSKTETSTAGAEGGSLGASADELKLSSEIYKKLLELQTKGIDVNALLQEFLEKRDMEIAQEKEKIASQLPQVQSRYIPVSVREVLKKEHGKKCAIAACKQDAEEIHHSTRFSLSKSHNPHYLAPLCHEHHVIAHNIDRKFQEHSIY